MKTVILAVLLIFSVSMANATDLTKVGFRAFSSATSKTCTVFGMSDALKKDGYLKTPIQGFSPDSAYSRSYVLGTKGFGNYSTTGYTNNITLSAMKFTCVQTGTATLEPVKIYLNGVETFYLTLESDTFVLGR